MFHLEGPFEDRGGRRARRAVRFRVSVATQRDMRARARAARREGVKGGFMSDARAVEEGAEPEGIQVHAQLRRENECEGNVKPFEEFPQAR